MRTFGAMLNHAICPLVREVRAVYALPSPPISLREVTSCITIGNLLSGQAKQGH